jgi:hypothetical protein
MAEPQFKPGIQFWFYPEQQNITDSLSVSGAKNRHTFSLLLYENSATTSAYNQTLSMLEVYVMPKKKKGYE